MVALAIALVGCYDFYTPAPEPPTIEAVGVATDVRINADNMRITLEDGSVHEISGSYRQLGDACCGFGVVIIGSDSEGPFIAGFPTQDGLAPDCYRDNAPGTERGGYIETWGVMWAKAASFVAPVIPDDGMPYPAGTRFCFNTQGQIASTIGP